MKAFLEYQPQIFPTIYLALSFVVLSVSIIIFNNQTDKKKKAIKDIEEKI